MPSPHVPGVSSPNQTIARTRDRQASARAGVATTIEHDQDPYYSSDEACWPVDPVMVLGRCPCGSLLYDTGCHRMGCGWCGSTFPYPEEEGPS